MRMLVRDTHAGKEYWDNVLKTNIFVPRGTTADFEVSVNPSSMLLTGIDIAYGRDSTVATEKAIDTDNQVAVESLEDMTIKELRNYAESKDVTIPKNVKTKAELLSVLSGL